MKREYKKIIEVPASGISGMDGGAWCFYFMYTKKKGTFILKGYMKELDKWIEDNDVGPHIRNEVLFHRGKARHSRWEFWKDNVHIYSPSPELSKRDKRWRKYQVIKTKDAYYSSDLKDERETLLFKRMPHKWIPEFDKL